jgi:phage protein
MSQDYLELKQIEILLHTIIEMLKNLNSEKRSSYIYTQKEILDLLSISPNTLKSWENRGLKRLEPPIEGTRTVYYHIDTVLEFLSHN